MARCRRLARPVGTSPPGSSERSWGRNVLIVEDGEHTLAFSAVAGSECGGTFLE